MFSNLVVNQNHVPVLLLPPVFVSDSDSHFGIDAVRTFIKKNIPAQAVGLLGLLAARLSFQDRNEDEDIMDFGMGNEQLLKNNPKAYINHLSMVW